VGDDIWADVADQFADEAYASVKGRVRTYVMHRQLLEHLPPPPAAILDVGGGAGHQSFPLARAGYEVTLLDPSPAMLEKARQRQPPERVTFLQADGEHADEAVRGQRFDAVLCHGVLGYLDRPDLVIEELCRCAADGGIVSIMAGNAKAAAVRPALERRWTDALAAFDSSSEIGVLGLPTRADTVEELSAQLKRRGVKPVCWYGVWLFVDGWSSVGPSWTRATYGRWQPSNGRRAAATRTVSSPASSICWGGRGPARRAPGRPDDDCISAEAFPAVLASVMI
jgi:SAM-dependent methyltransferase